MKKKRVAFIIADQKVERDYQMLFNSLRKFHNEEELPVIRISKEQIIPFQDEQFFYRAKPLVMKSLIKEYETVIGLDADQIILAPISHIWEGDFDVAATNNSSPIDSKNFPYQFESIAPLAYLNNGMVVVKNELFVELWDDLCHSFLFQGWRMREQDALNLLIYGFQNHFKLRSLDEGAYFHGLASKGYTAFAKMVNGKVMLPKNSLESWPDKEKQLVAYHFAGGHGDPAKGNYRILFSEEVSDYIDELVK